MYYLLLILYYTYRYFSSAFCYVLSQAFDLDVTIASEMVCHSNTFLNQ